MNPGFPSTTYKPMMKIRKTIRRKLVIAMSGRSLDRKDMLLCCHVQIIVNIHIIITHTRTTIASVTCTCVWTVKASSCAWVSTYDGPIAKGSKGCETYSHHKYNCNTGRRHGCARSVSQLDTATPIYNKMRISTLPIYSAGFDRVLHGGQIRAMQGDPHVAAVALQRHVWPTTGPIRDDCGGFAAT